MLIKERLINLLHEDEYLRYEKILIILAVEVNNPKSVKDINYLGSEAGLTEIYTWQAGAILNNNKKRGLAVHLKKGWILTDKGKRYLTKDLNIDIKSKRVAETATSLRNLLNDITDVNTKDFLSEAVSCFESKNFRAAVVLSWVGAMSVLQNHVAQNYLTKFNSEATRRNAKWKNAMNAEDLTRMKEKDFLNILVELSIIGKGVKGQLEHSLKLRNSCGHPCTLEIGENTVASHIEILIKNVFQKF